MKNFSIALIVSFVSSFLLTTSLTGCSRGDSHRVSRTVKGSDTELIYELDQLSSYREIIVVIPVPPFDEYGTPSYWKIVSR